MPRRRVALALIGTLHLGMAARLYMAQPPAGDPSMAIFHTLMPLWLRVTLWVLAGLLCIVLACSDRTERAGWVIAILMPVERAASYAWSVLMWIIPGWPPGALESLGLAGFWSTIAALVWLMAGWTEARRP